MRTISPYPQTAPNEEDVGPHSQWEPQADPSFAVDSSQNHHENEPPHHSNDSNQSEQDATPTDENPVRRHRPPHTPEDTQKIEQMLHAGYRPLEIRKELPHISKSNIYLKYTKYRKDGTSLVDKTTYRKTGRPKKLDPKLEEFIASLLASKPGLELAQIAEQLRSEKGVECSTTSVSRAIARVQGPRGRGLKSRRLGELKREKLEREGALGDQGVWKGRTGIVYARDLNQETMLLVKERDARKKRTTMTTEATKEDNRRVMQDANDDGMALDPQLRSAEQVADRNETQQDIYESPYLPMQHGMDPADLTAIQSLVEQKRSNET